MQLNTRHYVIPPPCRASPASMDGPFSSYQPARTKILNHTYLSRRGTASLPQRCRQMGPEGLLQRCREFFLSKSCIMSMCRTPSFSVTYKPSDRLNCTTQGKPRRPKEDEFDRLAAAAMDEPRRSGRRSPSPPRRERPREAGI